MNGDDGAIATKWRVLSGITHWEGLLDPLNTDLRRYIIRYGEMAQAAYDAFNNEKASPFAGASHYARKNLFKRVMLEQSLGTKYTVTKYVYATSNIEVPEAFILRSVSREAWNKESNWIGYVAVATEEGKKEMGRREVVVVWRGTVRGLEWVDDASFGMVSAEKLFSGGRSDLMVHQGWYSMYTSEDSRSPFNETSAREQVLSEVRRVVEEYRNEEISITITGHSMGAAIGTLNAADLITSGASKTSLVTAFLFSSPKVGNSSFRDLVVALKDLRILKIRNAPDVVPLYPLLGYADIGDELQIDTRKSMFLKSPGTLSTYHNLEVHMHGVAGAQRGAFRLAVARDICLVNKALDCLKEVYSVPVSWWCVENKGMVQQQDGSWKLMDKEQDDD